MARLSPTTNVGGSASSLIRSAGSLTSQIQSYQDSLKAFEYQDSAFTDAAYNSYSTYLNSRINTLNTSGTITDAQKALTLTKTLESATKSNISASLTRENISIMAGNATKQDKLNLITSQYVRSVNNGDLTLAQQLESQAYSLNQSILVDHQNAAAASTALAKATGTSDAAHQQFIARELINSVSKLNQDEMNPNKGGQKALDGAIKTWVNNNKDMILKLNPEAAPALSAAIAKGAQPNYLDLVQGAVVAAANAHLLAATAEMPYNPDTAQGYIDAASKLLNGDKISTLAGSFTYQEIAQLAQTPNALTYNASTQRYDLNPVTGHVGNEAGQIVPTRGTNAPNLTPAQIAQISSLNLNISVDNNGKAKDGVLAKTTDTTPDWFKKVASGEVNIYSVNNNLQFTGVNRNGAGQDIYTIVKDQNGKSAVMGQSSKTDPLGNHPQEIVHAEAGFTMINNSQPSAHTSFLGRIGSLAGNSAGNIFNIFGGHASAQDLINGGQATQFQIAQANAKAAAALLAFTPAQLPQVQVSSAAPMPSAPLKVGNVPNLQSITPGANPAIAPKTTNPQPGGASPQTPSSFNLQGGGGIRLQ